MLTRSIRKFLSAVARREERIGLGGCGGGGALVGGGQRRPRGHLVHCEQLKILLWPNARPRGPTRPRGTNAGPRGPTRPRRTTDHLPPHLCPLTPSLNPLKLACMSIQRKKICPKYWKSSFPWHVKMGDVTFTSHWLQPYGCSIQWGNIAFTK